MRAKNNKMRAKNNKMRAITTIKWGLKTILFDLYCKIYYNTNQKGDKMNTDIIDTRVIDVDKNEEVKKADVIVKARYNLSPLSIKFITCLITGLKSDDKADTEYVFKIKNFQELRGNKNKNIGMLIKHSLEELLSKPLHIEEKDGYFKCNWVSLGRYVDGAGEVRFKIVSDLKPYLLEAKQKFLKYELKNILPIKSGYAIRLYEILKDYYNMEINFGRVPIYTISVDELRDILQIPKSYRFDNIKKQIILKAQKELAEHTDISFEYEEIKRVRKIDKIKFTIKPNPKNMELPKESIYFKSERNFIKFLREKYINKAFFVGMLNGKQLVSLEINKKGLLMALKLKNNLEYMLNDDYIPEKVDFNATDSHKKYKNIYKLAKNIPMLQELLEQEMDMREFAKENKDLWSDIVKEINNVVPELKNKGEWEE